MTITAIIDCYNAAEFIAETIDSVLNQTRLPDELIIVNDGSTDDTAKCVENSIADIPWARLINKPNGGQISCISEGVKHAKCDLIALLDGDDAWRPQHLEKAEEKFLEFPKLSLYYSACQEFGDGDKNLYRSPAPGIIGQTLVVTAAGHAYVGGINASLVAKRTALQPYLPLPPEIERDWVVNADNIIIWITSLSGGHKYASEEVTVNYRLHANNQHHQLGAIQARAFRKSAIVRLFEYFDRTFYLPKDIARLLPHEYRAHPNKTKGLRSEYLNALNMCRHRISFTMWLTSYLRILLKR